MDRTCKNCKVSINHKRTDAKFCSDICRAVYFRKEKGLPELFHMYDIPESIRELNPYFYSEHMQDWLEKLHKDKGCNKPHYHHPPSSKQTEIECINCKQRFSIVITN